MAKKGSSKARSVEQEDQIAAFYGGRRSASSGGADNDQGDVRTPDFLIECKTMGQPTRVKRPGFAKDMEKITEEAWSEGKIPLLAIRYYDPESLLADPRGWVDVVIKRVVDDVE